jgi:predicted PurR-regulated permease PerM
MNWRAFVRWLVFWALWVLALLIFTQFRLVWLCVFAGGVLGFLTDCALDIFAARSHVREMRRQYEKRFTTGDQS